MINPNDPAYPDSICVDQYGNVHATSNYSHFQGMTKLEEFTKAAMQGLCAGIEPGITDADIKNISSAAVLIAKATIEQLNKQP